ncbi:hypothetical protein M9Y10_025429 [Tritrichomonas musculus]|uniref:Protein kinase domain-containing protein n=1 Tax=Tritrichomonas musculus TaxID=1915356 RepID=A0ABR2H9L3_9EUKA
MTKNTIGVYRLTEFLSSGSVGSVWECQNMTTGERLACKVISLEICLQDEFFSHFLNELYIHSRIRHPSISEIRDILVDGNQIFIIFELCNGGDLNDVVQDSGGLDEAQAKHYFFQIISAIKYIHQLGIAHRDIKLENVLISQDQCAKLTDFGLCKQVSGNSPMLTTCGTLVYAAPEIINEQPYNGLKTDIWSAGIVLYAMICCHFPWTIPEDSPPDQAMHETVKQILEGQIEVPDGITYELQNLMTNMLNTDPNLRPSAEEILQHPWFEGMEENIDPDSLVPDDNVISLVDSLIAELQKKKQAKSM